MPTGYRGVIVALGLISLAVAFGLGVYITALNYPKEQRYQSYRYAADEPTEVKAATAAQAGSKPFEYRTPCREPKGQDESDLCAQWKAANAAADGAWWTKWSVWIGVIGSTLLLWQIILTRQAVEDTSEATDAMRKANEIAEEAQRAWVSLKVVPELVRQLSGGRLYFQIDFVAKNIGGSAATNFDFYSKIFFLGHGQKARELDDEMTAQIEKWGGDYGDMYAATLLPDDEEISSIWTSFDEEEIRWWKIPFSDGLAAHPALLAAVFYETPSKPGIVQCSWRSWYLGSFNKEGRAIASIPQGKPAQNWGAELLSVKPFRDSLMHQEYPVEQGQPNFEYE